MEIWNLFGCKKWVQIRRCMKNNFVCSKWRNSLKDKRANMFKVLFSAQEIKIYDYYNGMDSFLKFLLSFGLICISVD
jgi:hypothetical protein